MNIYLNLLNLQKCKAQALAEKKDDNEEEETQYMIGSSLVKLMVKIHMTNKYELDTWDNIVRVRERDIDKSKRKENFERLTEKKKRRNVSE